MKEVIALNLTDSGLGNRLRFTLSSLLLAEKEQRKFGYFWPVTDKFEATFNDLWEDRIGPSLPLAQAKSDGSYLSAQTNWEEVRDEKIWRIFSAQTVRYKGVDLPWGDYLRTLTPSAAVRALIEGHRAEHPQEYIGMQVRLNPKMHEKTRELSPFSWYKEKIREHPDKTIFLSCDYLPAQEELLREFDNLVALPKDGTYNTKSALISSVADLYLLSQTKHIYAPYWSSFAPVAHYLSEPGSVLETSQGKYIRN